MFAYEIENLVLGCAVAARPVIGEASGLRVGVEYDCSWDFLRNPPARAGAFADFPLVEWPDTDHYFYVVTHGFLNNKFVKNTRSILDFIIEI